MTPARREDLHFRGTEVVGGAAISVGLFGAIGVVMLAAVALGVGLVGLAGSGSVAFGTPASESDPAATLALSIVLSVLVIGWLVIVVAVGVSLVATAVFGAPLAWLISLALRRVRSAPVHAIAQFLVGATTALAILTVWALLNTQGSGAVVPLTAIASAASPLGLGLAALTGICAAGGWTSAWLIRRSALKVPVSA